jgi:ABC-type multidrug transport system ATPase subunit
MKPTAEGFVIQPLLHGFPQERVSFLGSSGYVEQFDIQQAELTVEETVKFSARLRLDPNNEDTTRDEAGKLLFVNQVLEMLELTSI